MSKRQREFSAYAGKQSLKALTTIHEKYPAGPVTRADVFNWPSEEAVRQSPEELSRLHELFRRSVEVSSSYTGMSSECDALLKPLEIMIRRNGWNFEHDPIVFTHVCDNAHTPRQLQIRRSKELYGGSICVHPDVMGYMSDKAAKHVKELMLPCSNPDATKDVIIACYRQALDWLLAHAEKAFDPKQKIECLVHERMCEQFAEYGEEDVADAGGRRCHM